MDALSYQLSQVLFPQLEKQAAQVKSTLKHESKRFDRLTSQLSLTRSQLQAYAEESRLLQAKLAACASQFSKELCSELRAVKAPVSCLLDVCDKLLLVLDIKDRSWKSFRSLTKNFAAFKCLLQSVQTEPLLDSTVTEVLPYWKQQQVVRNKLAKISEAVVLLDWIVLVVEYNLKTEIVQISRKRVPELEKMVKQQARVMAELNSESASMEEMVSKAKSSVDEEELDCDECSEMSLTSKPYAYLKQDTEERVVFHSTVHRGTASGGIMQFSVKGSKDSTAIQSNFPNFNSESLYGEMPVNRLRCDSEERVFFEGDTNSVGCCRLKFFCF
jgi:hypothetical protein